MMAGRKNLRTCWIVVKEGEVVVWEGLYGEGATVAGPLHDSISEARRLARLHAERSDELESGDLARWELQDMRAVEVRKRGYRIKKMSPIVRSIIKKIKRKIHHAIDDS